MFYDIKPGSHKVPKKLIYKLYKYWSKTNLEHEHIGIRFREVYTGEENRANFFLSKDIASFLKHFQELKPKKFNYTKSKTYQKLFKDYLDFYNIKPGNVYVEADILYHLFDTFVTKRRRIGISMNKFTTLLINKFNKKDIGYGVSWFGVDENIKQHLPQEVVDRWRQGRVKYGKKKTNKIKQDIIKEVKAIYITEEEKQKTEEEIPGPSSTIQPKIEI